MKNAFVSAAVAVAVVLAGFMLVPKEEKPFRAQSEAVTEGNCYTFRGVNVCPNRVPMQTATTTVCAIKSPAATSTLVRASAQFRVSSSTASTITLAKAATFTATTTLLGQQYIIAAGAQATVVASSTTSNSGLQDFVFAPNQYFVVGMSGGIGTFSPSGFCNATFETL